MNHTIKAGNNKDDNQPVQLCSYPMPLGLIFFNTWFTDFFSQNIKVGGGKKKKIKITKKFFFINLKQICIREKK